MNNTLLRSVSKVAAGFLLLTGITTGVVATSAKPAEAGVVVSVGIGGGYHWASWRDGYGWHRRWVPLGWAPPVVYGGPAFYAPARFYPGPIVYGHPPYGGYRYGGYGYAHGYAHRYAHAYHR